MQNSIKTKAVVIKRHKSDFPNPLVLKKGDIIKLSDKKTNFIGWVWCTSSDRNSGWIPENYIEKTENGCRLTVDYNASEMDVEVGEKLIILSEESQWVWCQNGKNQEGWVPLENVTKL